MLRSKRAVFRPADREGKGKCRMYEGGDGGWMREVETDWFRCERRGVIYLS